MIQGHVLTTVLVAILFIIGCHSDSDYVVGRYHVQTTVISSTCPDELSSIIDALHLPTGTSVGQTSASSWTLERIGITGAGTHRISLTIHSPGISEAPLNIVGTLEHEFVRIELQQDINASSYQLYRTLLLRGSIDGDAFSGEVRTLLSNTDDSPDTFPFIPASSPCEVREEFLGAQ